PLLCGGRGVLHSSPTRRSSDLVDGGVGGHVRGGEEAAAAVGEPAVQVAAPRALRGLAAWRPGPVPHLDAVHLVGGAVEVQGAGQDRKSTRLNSSHVKISYAVFC